MSYSQKIIPISEFKLRHRALLQELINDGEPLVVTVQGRGAFVVQLPEVYYRLVQGFSEAQQLKMLHEALENDSARESNPAVHRI